MNCCCMLRRDYISMNLSMFPFFVVEARSESDGLVIKMHDGRCLRCVHNNPQTGNLAYYPPHPAIVLKMEDGSDTLLPLLVGMYFPAVRDYNNLTKVTLKMFCPTSVLLL